MLKKEELEHLQKLACIRLSPQEEKKLWSQLENIIWFLGQLKEIKVGKVVKKWWKKVKMENSLRTIGWNKDFAGKEKLMKNVKHEIVNNSIVIKSVLN